VQRIKEAQDVVGVRANRLKAGTVDVEQPIDVVKGTAVGADIGDIG